MKTPPIAPTVSVLLPVYNCRKHLAKALESLLHQTYIHFEIWAIDDGSTDGSLELLKKYAAKDPRIKCLIQDHGGIVKALNAGLAQAQGLYIARMDADDIALPNRFAKQVAFLEANKKAVAVGSWVQFIDDAGDPLFIYRMAQEPVAIEEELWKGNGGVIIHPVALFRKSALDAVGGYREAYRSLEDLDLYIRLLDIGPLYNLPEVLFLYRQHFKSVNFTSEHSTRRALSNQLMNEHLARKGKPPFAFNKQGLHEKSRLEIYHQWAGWALSEGFKKTALKYTLKALFAYPLKKRSWSFLKYATSQLL